VNSGLPAAPAVCAANAVTQTKFFDNMDTVASDGKWVTTGDSLTWDVAPSTSRSGPLWFYGSDSTNPYGFANLFASSGGDTLWGDDPDPSLNIFTAGGSAPVQHSVQFATGVAIPAGTTYLRFDHAFGFEASELGTTPGNYDGGVVEYSVDNGATWKDAGSLMAGTNGYGVNAPTLSGTPDTTIVAGFGNPLGGKSAFVQQSQGYLTTRATLSGLAGKTVKVRWHIATDSTGGDYGWFLDNVKVYSCVPLLAPAASAPVVLAATSLTWPLNDRNRTTTTGTHITYRVRTATPGSLLGAYGTAKAVTTNGSLAIPLVAAGGTTCVNLIGADSVTPASSSIVRCFTKPVDDRSLKLTSTTAWTKVASATAYNRTLTTSKVKGALLTLPAARGTSLVLVAQSVKGGGSVGVYVKGKRIALISLNSATTTAKRTFTIVNSGLAGVPVVLKVETSGLPVSIDGIGVRP
jgi:hypothetical protein